MSPYETKWSMLKEKGREETDVLRLAEELHRHQIELEAQNKELQEAQAQLEKSHKEYMELFDFAPIGYFVLDKAYTIADANITGATLLGIERSNLLNQPFSRYVDKGSYEILYSQYHSVFKDGKRVECELQIAKQSETPIFAHLILEPVKDAEGNIIECRIAAMDITDRKISEEERRGLTEELHRSNSDLEEFASIVSHDLKEPLRTMSGFVDLLRRQYKGQLDEKGREYLNFAISGAKRMDTMLSGLLEYSRVQTKARPISLTEGYTAFNTAVTNLWASITENNAIVTSDPIPSVKADGTQLVQLFQNLIGNAIKFRSEQNPKIHVGCKRQENGWLFSVGDNGIGIVPEKCERIFIMFQQLNPTDRYSGHGIGLAICKKIVERHGGKIWVESQQEKGSTFFFTIPD